MKQIVHHEQCKRCGECCRFRADRQDFAPIFTAGEIEAIRESRGALPMPEFQPFKDAANIFQIRLVEAEKPTPNYPYVCPFLDEENYGCSIYDVRPFDCRVWPFIILKETATGEVRLAHFTGNACLAMQEVSPEDLSAYEAYMQEWVTSEAFLAFLREHPQLIWENANDGRYMTIPSKDLTQYLAHTSGA